MVVVVDVLSTMLSTRGSRHASERVFAGPITPRSLSARTRMRGGERGPHRRHSHDNLVQETTAFSRCGIHLYPVAASGIDDLAEFTMRTAAEVTGGRYLFLTNDSGIGGSHAEPHIPCYYVTTLE